MSARTTDDLLEEATTFGSALATEWDEETTLWLVAYRVGATRFVATDTTLHAALFSALQQASDAARASQDTP